MNSLHTSVSLLYIFYSYGQELPDTYIVHYTAPLAWFKAGNFCLKDGGVLESNITEVRRRLISTNYYGSVWLGIYESLTPWAIIWGCYLINDRIDIFTVKHSEQWQCQQICSHTEYFSVKDTRCFCIKNYQFEDNDRECDDECLDNKDCLKVLKSYTGAFEKHTKQKETAEKDLRCVSVSCSSDRQLKRTSDICNRTYGGECDNRDQLGFKFTSQILAEKECADHDSFLRWYPDNHCDVISSDFLNEHFTNARREVEKFTLDKTNRIPKALRCYKLVRNGGHVQQRMDNCDNTFSYFCRFEGNGNNTIPEFHTTVESVVHKSTSTAGIVAGSIFGFAALVVAVAVLIFIYKRRFNHMENKKPHVRNPQRTSPSSASETQTTVIRETAVYTEIKDDQLHKESRQNAYSFASPIYGKSLTQENEKVTEPAYTQISEEQFNNETAKRLDIFVKSYPMLPDANDNLQVKTSKHRLLDEQAKSETFGRSQNINFEIDEIHDEHFQHLKSSAVHPVQNTNYSLAKPVRESGEIDPYSDNQDYDKLNSVQKKGDDTQCKVYDHLPTTVEADPTYDHSVINSPKVHDNNYDHFTFDDDNI